jgi:GNAT superfamily N-acetyltransferase
VRAPTPAAALSDRWYTSGVQTIRDAMPTDALELVRLRALMFVAMGRVADDAAWKTAAADRFEVGLAAGDVLGVVVEDPGERNGLVACATATLFHTIPSPGATKGLQAWLGSVCTDVAHRRAGLARATVSALLHRLDALGVEEVSLNATPDGMSMYESFGFRPTTHPGLRRRRPR